MLKNGGRKHANGHNCSSYSEADGGELVIKVRNSVKL